MNKLKGIFIPLKCYFWFGRTLKVPCLYFGNTAKILDIKSYDILWKDKYDSPRHEESPYVAISILGYTLFWTWKLYPHLKHEDYNYWEQALWYLYYYHNDSYGRLDAPNIEKARQSWPWEDCRTKQSTWNDEFLIKNI